MQIIGLFSAGIFLSFLEFNFTGLGILNLKIEFNLITMLILLNLITSIMEEVIFRKRLLDYLNEIIDKFYISNIIVSLLFSILHFSSLKNSATIFLISMSLGIIKHKTEKLIFCMTFHFSHNFFIDLIYGSMYSFINFKGLFDGKVSMNNGSTKLLASALFFVALNKIYSSKNENVL